RSFQPDPNAETRADSADRGRAWAVDFSLASAVFPPVWFFRLRLSIRCVAASGRPITSYYSFVGGRVSKEKDAQASRHLGGERIEWAGISEEGNVMPPDLVPNEVIPQLAARIDS